MINILPAFANSIASTWQGMNDDQPHRAKHAKKGKFSFPPIKREIFVVFALALMAAGASGGIPELSALLPVHTAQSSVIVMSTLPSAPSATATVLAAAPAAPSAPKPTPEVNSLPALLAATAPDATDTTTAPGMAPTPTPTAAPTAEPTPAPTPEATAAPTIAPTAAPAVALTQAPAAPKTLAAKASPMILRVYKGSQTVVAIQKVNGVETALRIMICSTGRFSSWTPTGTFAISAKYDYHQLDGAMGQYASRFNGGILFHSVPINNSAKTAKQGKSGMLISYYKKLGSMASLGCVRLLVRDAKWIYTTCPIGTKVEVVNFKSPFGLGTKPALISGTPYMSANGVYGWDPTDPDPRNPYQQKAHAEAPRPTASPSAAPAATQAPIVPSNQG